MSASNKVSNFVLLPELILEKSYYLSGGHKILHCSKKKMQEYCPYLLLEIIGPMNIAL